MVLLSQTQGHIDIWERQYSQQITMNTLQIAVACGRGTMIGLCFFNRHYNFIVTLCCLLLSFWPSQASSHRAHRGTALSSDLLSKAVPFWRSHGCGIFGRPLCFLNIWFIPQTLHVPLVSGQSLWASKYEFLEGREWRLGSTVSSVPPYCALRDENTDGVLLPMRAPEY